MVLPGGARRGETRPLPAACVPGMAYAISLRPPYAMPGTDTRMMLPGRRAVPVQCCDTTGIVVLTERISILYYQRGAYWTRMREMHRGVGDVRVLSALSPMPSPVSAVHIPVSAMPSPASAMQRTGLRCRYTWGGICYAKSGTEKGRRYKCGDCGSASQLRTQRGIGLRPCYAVPGTELGMRLRGMRGTKLALLLPALVGTFFIVVFLVIFYQLSSYACAMRCPVLSWRMAVHYHSKACAMRCAVLTKRIMAVQFALKPAIYGDVWEEEVS
eukprot:3434281-Rhodomonas_salina.2